VRQVDQNWLTGDQEILNVPIAKANGRTTNGHNKVLDRAIFDTLLDATLDAVIKKEDPLDSATKNFDYYYRKNKSDYIREFRSSGR
jgi:hypothetical protein